MDVAGCIWHTLFCPGCAEVHIVAEGIDHIKFLLCLAIQHLEMS